MSTKRSLRRGLRCLAAALAGSVVLTGCEFDVYSVPLPGGTDTGADPIEVTVAFRDVLDLVPQSSVKVNDVSVGKITDVELTGYTAEVTLELRGDTELPDDAVAEIRQTSLLGEKFVSLSAPEDGGSAAPLGDGDHIPLERSGRNPEVEEVLGALSLVLNGGGVAQLRTIARELNLALEGREDATKSVLTQIADLMGQLDTNKDDIVAAIESVNQLAIGVKDQIGSIDAALEELPSALDSIDRQREDLVRMLRALSRLSDVGVRVIDRSKDVTLQSLRQLQPVLTQLANSGDDFVNAFNVFLTFPFVDEVVGRDPQVARNLHMGDYTNLSLQLDIDVTNLPDIPGVPCTPLRNLGSALSLDELLDLDSICQQAQDVIAKCANQPSVKNCRGLPAGVLQAVCDGIDRRVPLVCGLSGLLGDLLGGGGGGGGGGLLGGGGGLLGGGDGGRGGGLLEGLLGRAPTGGSESRPTGTGPTMGQLSEVYDPALVTLLTPGMVLR